MTKAVMMDTETGGLEDKHPTIQIAALAFDVGTLEPIDRFEIKLKFDEADCDPEALEMNSYDRETWDREAQPPVFCLRAYAGFLRNHASVKMISRKGRPYYVAQTMGHNADRFDNDRLIRDFRRADLFLPGSFRSLDTCQRLFWYFWERPHLPQPPDFKLETMAIYFGLADEIEAAGDLHDAAWDCEVNLALLRALRRELHG